MKKAIVVVSFGTSYETARKLSYDVLMTRLNDSFPEHPVYMAFTSQMVRKTLSKQGIHYPDLPEVLTELGEREAIFVFTHLLPGFEYEKALGLINKHINYLPRLGRPLLTTELDRADFASALNEIYPPRPGITRLFIGHGTAHAQDRNYDRLEALLGEDTIIATLEGKNNISGLKERLSPERTIQLIPLLYVAGDHALNDIFGEDGIHSALSAEGYVLEGEPRGLGEYEEIQRLVTEQVRNCLRGRFYGVGVGPGDPELLTLKAVRILEQCPVWAVPRTMGENTLALDIVEKAVSSKDKELIYLDFPMTRDKKVSQANHVVQTFRLLDVLDLEQDVAMLNLGDASTFSTVHYLYPLLKLAGVEAYIVPGITSYSAAAAKLGRSLTSRDLPLTILPAAYTNLEDALDRDGSKVIMKPSRDLSTLLELLKEKGLTKNTGMVVNCGLPDESIFSDISEVVDTELGYFSTILIDDKK
ncbi:MAG TPA: precorrin-2 C(20)-methyltransferase [Clostridiaceae bacterium]|nr:precorrin-2 C(20)-methyltransferase [Clostridiaceae bacterium]